MTWPIASSFTFYFIQRGQPFDVCTKFEDHWESQFKLLDCSRLVRALPEEKRRVYISYFWPCFSADFGGKVNGVFHCGVMDGIE